MFTGNFKQDGNSCGAATLAIAANQLGKAVTLDTATLSDLYKKTSDPALSNLLGKTKPEDYYSTPEKMMAAAKGLGLTAKLYEKTDINATALPSDIQKFKAGYVDALTPTAVDTATLKGLLTKDSYLQLLVYLDGVKQAMHWVLLQTDGSSYAVYDTAFPVNKTLASGDVDKLLAFDGAINTGRGNNFYGVAILLTK